MVLVNFSDLKKLIHDQFDHYLLNDLTPFKGKSPSTEIVAQTIYNMVQDYLSDRDNQPQCTSIFTRNSYKLCCLPTKGSEVNHG